VTLLTVERALRLLHVAVFDGSLTVSKASEISGTSASSAYRLLKTLSDGGLIERDARSGRFRPGPELLRMAARTLGTNSVRAAAIDEMSALANEWRESVTLCIRLGTDRVLYFESVQSPRWVQYLAPLGESSQLHVGSSGRAILAHLSEQEIEAALSGALERHTTNTPVDPHAIREQLDLIRRRGYAVSYGERVEQAIGVSAPIFDARGEVAGSVLLGMPEGHVDSPERIDEIGAAVQATANRISLRLGWIAEEPSDTEFDASAARAKPGADPGRRDLLGT
jgi:DNA-binding IclR family transcriptional regulator